MRGWLALLVVAPLGLRVAFAAVVPLSPDEAYYAAWAGNLELSYLDHPPMCAWMMRLGVELFGATSIGVRSPGFLLGIALPLLLYAAARRFGVTPRGALTAVAAASATLLLSAGAVIVTPDTPLALFFALATYFAARQLARPSAGNATLLGLSLALCVASKMTGVALAGAVLIAPGLGTLRHRALAFGLAASGLAPSLVWNAAHDYPMFTFHAARMAERGGLTLQYLGEFASAQVALLCVGPAVWLGAFYWGSRRRASPSPAWRFAAYASALPLAATCGLSLVTKVEANWMAPAFLPAFAALGLWLDRRAVAFRWRAWVVGGAAVLTTLAHAHVVWRFLPLDPQRDPSAQLHLGPALATAVRARLDPEQRGGALLTSRYQEAALLQFYLREAARPIATLPPDAGWRRSQYDVWPHSVRARQAPSPTCLWRAGEARCAGASSFTVGSQVYELGRCEPEGWRTRPCTKVASR